MTDKCSMCSKARMPKNIVMSPQDGIDIYNDIATDFLKKVFGVNRNECFISDESRLTDFATCCIPDDHADINSLDDMYEIGEGFMMRKIKDAYGIVVDPGALLIDVFALIHTTQNE
jgi:hypothetical protein